MPGGLAKPVWLPLQFAKPTISRQSFFRRPAHTPASLDTESRGSQLALTCWTWQLLQGRQTATEKSEQTREVFAEENSEEVGKLAPIVESVRERVSELVAQWPEHATL